MRWVTGVIFSLLGVLLLSQGMNLRAITEVDGDGIGVYFLGMEINERVPVTDIPSYANGFLGTGTILLIFAVFLFVILLKDKGRSGKKIQS